MLYTRESPRQRNVTHYLCRTSFTVGEHFPSSRQGHVGGTSVRALQEPLGLRHSSVINPSLALMKLAAGRSGSNPSAPTKQTNRFKVCRGRLWFPYLGCSQVPVSGELRNDLAQMKCGVTQTPPLRQRPPSSWRSLTLEAAAQALRQAEPPDAPLPPFLLEFSMERLHG